MNDYQERRTLERIRETEDEQSKIELRVEALEAIARMSETDTQETYTEAHNRLVRRVNTLEALLDRHERYLSKCGGYPVEGETEEPLPAPLDNAETLPGQSWTDPRVTPDAAPDDLVERTQNWLTFYDEDSCIPPCALLREWLERAELRPTREEAMALAEEKQRIVEDVSEATCRAMDDTGKIEGRLRARIDRILAENAELRARATIAAPKRKYTLKRCTVCGGSGENCDPCCSTGWADALEILMDDEDEEEEEVSNPGPGPREVWCGYATKIRPDKLMTDDTSFLVTIAPVFERDKHYWITVTEADDTPEEGRDG